MYTVNGAGFYIIEPSFYTQLNWNMNDIMKCLEFMRLNINNELFKHKTSKYFLLRLTNFVEQHYPVIGVQTNDLQESNELASFIDVYDRVENYINSYGVEKMKIKSQNLDIISWEELKVLGVFPNSYNLYK